MVIIYTGTIDANVKSALIDGVYDKTKVAGVSDWDKLYVARGDNINQALLAALTAARVIGGKSRAVVLKGEAKDVELDMLRSSQGERVYHVPSKRLQVETIYLVTSESLIGWDRNLPLEERTVVDITSEF